MAVNKNRLFSEVALNVYPHLTELIREINLRYNTCINVNKMLQSRIVKSFTRTKKHVENTKICVLKQKKPTNILNRIKSAQETLDVKYSAVCSSYITLDKFVCNEKFVVFAKTNDNGHTLEHLTIEDIFFLKNKNIEFKLKI